MRASPEDISIDKEPKILAKFAIWGFGLFVAALPLFASIVGKPSELHHFLSIESYIQYQREILFIGLATCAISLAETLEILVFESSLASKEKTTLLSLLLLLIAKILLMSHFYHSYSLEPSTGIILAGSGESSGESIINEDINGTLIIVTSSLLLVVWLKYKAHSCFARKHKK